LYPACFPTLTYSIDISYFKLIARKFILEQKLVARQFNYET
jgi:hypothetical protein